VTIVCASVVPKSNDLRDLAAFINALSGKDSNVAQAADQVVVGFDHEFDSFESNLGSKSIRFDSWDATTTKRKPSPSIIPTTEPTPK
jgi:hypothetical protein